MNRWTFLLFVVLSVAGVCFAQDTNSNGLTITTVQAQNLGPVQPNVLWLQDGMGGMPEGNVAFRTLHLVGEQELVRNAPYSATATNESTQVLADGNRIVNKSSSFVARDSQGRMRREEIISKVGPLNVEGPKLITIADPASHTNFILMPDTQTARVLKDESISIDIGDAKTHVHEIRQKMIQNSQARLTTEIKHEDLGTQEIDGLSCQGKRDTVTIPAGRIGNEQPIVTTNEVWTSSDLHVVVSEKHNDPRFGETVYRLTGISRSEPDASLFQVPNGYKTISPSEGFSSKD